MDEARRAAHRFIHHLSERAFAGLPSRPELVDVEPDFHKGWLARYRLPRGHEVVIELAPDGERAASRSRNFAYSYRGIDVQSPMARRRWSKMGAVLCRRLARADLRRAPPTLLSPPTPPPESPARRTLSLELPGPCDRACVFCGSNHERLVAPEEFVNEISQGERRRIADPLYMAETRARIRRELAAAADDPPAVRVSFSGTDAHASPLFDEAVDYAYELGFRDMDIQTAGTRLVDPEVVDRLVARSVTSVSLTAHGASDEVFDRVGGKKGARTLFFEALELLLDRGAEVNLAVPCIEENVHELPELFAQLAPYPVRIAAFVWVPNEGYEAYFERVTVRYEDLATALDRASTVVPSGRVQVEGVPPCIVSPRLAEHFTISADSSHDAAAPRTRLAACPTCPHRVSCRGALELYVKHFGDWTA